MQRIQAVSYTHLDVYKRQQIDRAEHMGIALPVDVKEQIFEYANLIGEEEKVRTLVKI